MSRSSPRPGRGSLPDGAVVEALAGVDVVFPLLHGPFGEDGTVQGLLELADVPYVGAGVTASAVAMDKDLFKAVLRDHGVPVARNLTLRHGDATVNPFSYPVFVKPARLGSSIGISKAHDETELEAAVALAFGHDEKVLVEEFVDGVEIEVGVLGNRDPAVSLPGEIVAHNEWYDYAAKYDAGGMELVVPARIPEKCRARARELAHRLLRCCRVRGDGARGHVREPERRGARQRAQHDPRLHGDERLREALRRQPASTTCRSSSACSEPSALERHARRRPLAF